MGKLHWIIYLVIAKQTIWSALLLVSDTPLNVTAIHTISRLGLGQYSLAIIYAISVGLSIAALVRWFSWWQTFLLFLPQLMLVVYSAFGSSMAIWMSQFADGVERPQTFMAADQLVYVLIAIAYVGAVVGVVSRRNGGAK